MVEEQFTSYIRIFGSTWKVGVQILSQNCGDTEKERFNWAPYASSSPETTKSRIASKSFSFSSKAYEYQINLLIIT